MRVFFLVIVLFATLSLPSAAMEFALGGTDHRGGRANWIQASGAIDENTLEDFTKFLDEGPDWLPSRIRLNSPGGNLFEGVRLGEELRRRGFETEVGDHEAHPEWPNMPYWDFTRRIPGICASACAYAFMGGVDRRIGFGSRLGFHQFSSPSRSETQLRGEKVLVEEGLEQKISAMLLNYVVNMGIDGRVFVNAGLTGPEEMHWVEDGPDARETGLVYSPSDWTEWKIEPLGEGVIAESKRLDGLAKMSAICTSSSGAFFDIFVSEEPSPRNEGADWSLRKWLVKQCLPAGSYSQGSGAHSIIGNRVAVEEIRIVDRPGGFAIRFPLGSRPFIAGSPGFLNDDTFGACLTDRFIGNDKRMEAAIRIAFLNCMH